MKCIGIVWLVLATTVRVFGQDAPSALQAYGDAGKYAADQFTLPEKGPDPDGSGIARPNGSTEVVWAETSSTQMMVARDKAREAPESNEWIQDDPTKGKPLGEVKKVAKARNQAKPEKLDRRSARGYGDNRPSARRPNRAGRLNGAGRPFHKNR